MNKFYNKHTKYVNKTWGVLIRVLFLGFLCFSWDSYEAYAEEERIEGSVYEVSQDGTKDFISIQEGVDAVESGDTLLIHPGVYEEAVWIKDKTVNLMGVHPDLCILQYEAIDYDKVPLFFGAGTISNLTIYGYHQKTIAGEIPIQEVFNNSSDVGKEHFSGYAIHIEQSYTQGKDITIRNCNIISENSHCLGMGCRGDSTVTFEQCNFVAKGNGGCVFFHDAFVVQEGGESNLIFIDSQMTNYLNPYVITIEAIHEINRMYLTFKNVKVSTVAYVTKEPYDETNMNIYPMSGVIKQLDEKESTSYMYELMQCESVLQKKQILPEGITVIATPIIMGAKDLQMADMRNVEQEVPMNCKKSSVIYIYNESGQLGDGWCGLMNTFLTSDSYGNTLAEMNTCILNSLMLQ